MACNEQCKDIVNDDNLFETHNEHAVRIIRCCLRDCGSSVIISV